MKYYTDFGTFKQKIDAAIDSTSGRNKPKIDSLIGKGIQLFMVLSQLGKILQARAVLLRLDFLQMFSTCSINDLLSYRVQKI